MAVDFGADNGEQGATFTNLTTFGPASGTDPLPITLAGGADRLVVVLLSDRRSSGVAETLELNGVPGHIATQDDWGPNNMIVAYWLDGDLPSAGAYEITHDGLGSNRLVSAVYVENARQKLVDSAAEQARTDNQNTFTLDCDGASALIVMAMATTGGSESAALELYNENSFAGWYQVGAGQTIQASVLGSQSSDLNIAVAAAFEPLVSGPGADINADPAHSVSRTPSPSVATGAAIAPVAARSDSRAPNPTTGAGAVALPSAAFSASAAPNPTTGAGAVALPSAAFSTSAAPNPSTGTGAVALPSAAFSTSIAAAPTVAASADADFCVITLRPGVMIKRAPLRGAAIWRHRL